MAQVIGSLNGDYYSHPDGTVVLLYPDSREYTVTDSFLVYSGEGTLTIMYNLSDILGSRVTATHTFIIKKPS